jgi:flagellar hook-basal body complex protein FliE
VLKAAIQGVDQYQQNAGQAIQQFLQGNGELHNVALATQRAEMAFDLGLQIRNKIVSAYQEIMKMQL